jgi:hypothetical protein
VPSAELRADAARFLAEAKNLLETPLKLAL